MQIIPIRELKNTVAIEKRCSEANGPVFITKNGYGRLVVMDIDYYERTLQKLYEAKLLNDSLDDLASGRVADGTSVLKEVREKYGF